VKHFLGKIHLRWCRYCNLPVLDRTCNICKRDTTQVKITPPGDVRPAFPKDVEMIKSILREQFGVKEDIFKNKLVLLNKIPGIDYMKEIILDGAVFAILKYDIEGYRWSLLPTVEGARKIVNAGGLKKVVGIGEDVVPHILERHASVLRPGVRYFSQDIRRGDDVIVVVMGGDVENIRDTQVIGVGRARMDYREVMERDRGMVVKIRHAETPREAVYLRETGDFKTSIERMILANEHVITKYEREALGFIKNTVERIKKPVVIAYSGGKDSLTVLLLSLKALRERGIKFDVIFVDTGLEIPETLENVEDVEKRYNLEIIRIESEDFWEKLEEYGPPGRDYRWCSEVCKMKPVERFIRSRYKDDGCLTLVGLRKYESINRSKKPRIWKSRHVKGQIQCAPILHWSAMHVWLYLFKNRAPYNRVYTLGFDRVGCYICPAMELGEIELMKRYYPQLWERWERYLREYARKNNLDEEWVRGGWRWRYRKNS